MGTYALGAYLAEQHGTAHDTALEELVRNLRNQGSLRALPIQATDKATGELIAGDGTRLCECEAPGSGRWIPVGPLHEGAIKYLGSASHAGHIELKALWVRHDDAWYNIITLQPES